MATLKLILLGLSATATMLFLLGEYMLAGYVFTGMVLGLMLGTMWANQ